MFYLLLILFLILYILCKYFLHTLPEAYPGGEEEVKTGRRILPRPIDSVFMGRGGFKFRRFVVSEDQSKFGLHKGTILEVCCRKDLKKNDLIVIFQNSRGYIIRKLQEISGDDLLTYYYDKEGKQVYDDYKLEEVVGRIEYLYI